LLVKTLEGRTLCLPFSEVSITVAQIKSKLEDICGIPASQQRLSTNCRELSDSLLISEFCSLSLNVRLVGGKGGFGALLRGAGAKAGAKKTTNYDDCRDLTGRRIRHVKNEKKLSEWYSTEKEREQAEAERRRILKEEEAAKNEHKFDSTQYIKSLKEIESSIEQSVEEGIKASKKKKAEPTILEEPPTKKIKRNMLWTEFDEIEFENLNADTKEEANSEKSTTSNTELKPVIPNQEEKPFDLNSYSSAEELESLGLEKLKLELQKLGLLCGGTLKDRAQRLFSIKGKDLKDVDSKLFAKKKKGK